MYAYASHLLGKCTFMLLTNPESVRLCFRDPVNITEKLKKTDCKAFREKANPVYQNAEKYQKYLKKLAY